MTLIVSSLASPRKRGGRGSFLFGHLRLLPALEGRRLKPPTLVHRRCVLWPRPYRAGQRACSSSLSLGEALLPPDPHPTVERAKALSPPLGVLAGFTFLVGSSSSVTGCSPPRVPRGGGTGSFLFVPPRLLPALVGRLSKLSLSSFVVTAFSGLALTGRPGELVPPLSQSGGRQAGHLWNSALLASHKPRQAGVCSSASCGPLSRTEGSKLPSLKEDAANKLAA